MIHAVRGMIGGWTKERTENTGLRGLTQHQITGMGYGYHLDTMTGTVARQAVTVHKRIEILTVLRECHMMAATQEETRGMKGKMLTGRAAEGVKVISQRCSGNRAEGKTETGIKERMRTDMNKARKETGVEKGRKIEIEKEMEIGSEKEGVKETETGKKVEDLIRILTD